MKSVIKHIVIPVIIFMIISGAYVYAVLPDDEEVLNSYWTMIDSFVLTGKYSLILLTGYLTGFASCYSSNVLMNKNKIS